MNFDRDRTGKGFELEEQEQDILKKSVSIRMPVFKRSPDGWADLGGVVNPKERLDAYEEHMVLSAYIEAELVADKLRCIEELNEASDHWNDLQTESDFAGTQVSQAQRDRERREEDPALFRLRRALTQRIESLVAEIERMERQAKICSRIHTFQMGT